MKYVLHNLRTLTRQEPVLFLVMLLCILSSSLIMNFSYGLYQNYHVQKYETEGDFKELYPTLNTGATMTKADVVRYLGALSDTTRNELDIIYCTAALEKFPSNGYTKISRFGSGFRTAFIRRRKSPKTAGSKRARFFPVAI